MNSQKLCNSLGLEFGLAHLWARQQSTTKGQKEKGKIFLQLHL